jgi:hypothetical protein
LLNELTGQEEEEQNYEKPRACVNIVDEVAEGNYAVLVFRKEGPRGGGGGGGGGDGLVCWGVAVLVRRRPGGGACKVV